MNQQFQMGHIGWSPDYNSGQKTLADMHHTKGTAPAYHGANALVKICHQAALDSGWWNGLLPPSQGTVAEKLLLIHSEVSEATEGFRKDLMDDKIPTRKMVEVELADALIRICDLAGAMGLDLGGAVAEKLAYNATRADHKPENRAKEGGKKF